jgi:capsule polysaccharide export protein KpsE/RkpR
VPPADEEEVGLASFSASRSERRAKALEEAQAGMQQVAAERQAAEQEYAAAKTAAAQAEADAMRKHADKLAAAEQEALEQRKNSWSGRLKQIVSTTIGAAGGAFFGGVGSRAGEAAANAVFKE